MPRTTKMGTAKSYSPKKRKGAPYVETDRAELGDKRLNPEESVIRERESLLSICATRRIWGQDELEKAERADGPRLPYTELLRRIHLCNPAIVAKDGMEGSVALYIRKRPEEYTETDNILRFQPWLAREMNIPVPKDEFFIDHKYLTGFRKEAIAEYSYITIDSSLLPHREMRGWRSVLIALIKAGAVRYSDAISIFGNPEGDKRSTRWFDQLQKFAA